MTIPRAALAVLVVGVLGLAACGSSVEDDEPPQDRTDTAVTDTWPLTGLDVRTGDARRRHPVLVLKMDNTDSSAPQVGLSQADLVVEELVEGGVTRLAAFYYTKLPENVGPVRSMRASDIGIVSPADATVVTSGAAGVTIDRIRKAGITYVNEGGPGFYREASRVAPYNLFTSLRDVAAAKRRPPTRPEDYLTFGTAADLPKGAAARTIDVSFSSRHTTSWTYRRGGYVNDNTFAADGDEFPADSVLVLAVKVGDAGYLDPAGNTVPETRFEGTGAALLFHGGRAIAATWTKPALDQPLTLATDEGVLPVPAGRTWIELVPENGGGLTYTGK